MRRKKKNVLLPIVLFVAVLALSIGGLILAQNLRNERIANPGDISSSDDIPRITADEAYQAYINGEVVIVDTRSEADFQTQHISGAVHMPLDQIEARMHELDPDV
jgi:hypothetical protein